MKKASKSEIFIAIISIFSAFAMILIKTKLSKLCTETNSPFLIFLDLQLNGYVLVILFFAIFFLICCISSLKTLLSDLKVFKDSFISWKSILILAVLQSQLICFAVFFMLYFLSQRKRDNIIMIKCQFVLIQRIPKYSEKGSWGNPHLVTMHKQVTSDIL